VAVCCSYRDGVHRARRHPRHREGLRAGQARDPRVVNGVVLDLAVNSNSERACWHRAAPEVPGHAVCLPVQHGKLDGADTSVVAEVPLLGNRVDRFRWNGSVLISTGTSSAALVPERRNNVANPTLRYCAAITTAACSGSARRQALRHHRRQRPPRLDAEHHGGLITTRVTRLPTTNSRPEPDDAHLTGVILRSTTTAARRGQPVHESASSWPAHRRRARCGSRRQSPAGLRLRRPQQLRHDVRSRKATCDHGERRTAFDEINRVERGFNGAGPVDGPLHRVETTRRSRSQPASRQWPQRAAAVALPGREHRRRANAPGRRCGPARLAPARPGVQLEAGGAAAGLGFVDGTPRQAVRRRPHRGSAVFVQQQRPEA